VKKYEDMTRASLEASLEIAQERMDAMLVKIGEQVQDIKFLLGRAAHAGSMHLGCDRETGLSSNCIIAIAYEVLPIDEQILPADQSDLDACFRAFDKLPFHRRTKTVEEAMFRATQHITQKKNNTAPARECSILGFLGRD